MHTRRISGNFISVHYEKHDDPGDGKLKITRRQNSEKKNKWRIFHRLARFPAFAETFTGRRAERHAGDSRKSNNSHLKRKRFLNGTYGTSTCAQRHRETSRKRILSSNGVRETAVVVHKALSDVLFLLSAVSIVTHSVPATVIV